MKKIIIRISVAAIIALVMLSIYFIFIRVDMSSSTKIICKYFEDMKPKEENRLIDTSDIKINNMDNFIDEVESYPIIKHKGVIYQIAGYELDKEAVDTDKNIESCYIVDSEDVYAEKNITEDVYELKNISSEYAVAYKIENTYYLYQWLNFNGDTDIKAKTGNFDELFSKVNKEGNISFYEIRIFIHNCKSDSYSNKMMNCYGDIDKLLNKYIKGKELENIGFGVSKRRTITGIWDSRYKEASISIVGYMKDTRCFVLLSISDGYLNFSIFDINVNVCFYIGDDCVEKICQDILQNFEIYPEEEKLQKQKSEM